MNSIEHEEKAPAIAWVYIWRFIVALLLGINILTDLVQAQRIEAIILFLRRLSESL